jgi:hypothetical protein
MQTGPFQGYSSAFAITTSDTTVVSLRAIYVGGAGNVTINPGVTGGTSVLFTAPPVGTIIPIMLDQGRVMATGTTATVLVGLA